jgi:hypothetical protein
MADIINVDDDSPDLNLIATPAPSLATILVGGDLRSPGFDHRHG